MPTYEFQCESCGQVVDAIFRIADRPEYLPHNCECGGALKFIMSAPMIECDDVVNSPWVRDFASHHNRQGGTRNRAGGAPIQSRTDYKKYLQRHDLRPTRGENISEV